mmetsp:Transcript_7982/g.18001  ORF Transcript_7982/g.18001 Transcript_7982/m.18001 type:complete len:424 (-) Transcript_7982:1116-2387(-)|eukprot:CAMPEP_0172305690 /NCGR_PEP_ID=MMETSP1058-20130122/6934_1 /TAXON_ID=83371 /ORGANISM="Detonula confervacea, Strain CCMP 353" /LENGTH=423 /DNA_ID=CAMNT_0013017375 /DNA_START=54 /DNA_END=1325 /DNA_ORIENTATION=+
MANASSGPVRRNFGAKNASSQRKNGSVARAFFLTLIALVVALSALAIHLSRQVMQSPSHDHSHSTDDAPVKAVASPGAAAADVAPPSNNNIISTDNAKDRVYCMIPFIWNAEIYTAIMNTWGQRCDVINFLTDSIVGGKLKGDKITDDPSIAYRPYWEYPSGTFPDNVKFINMTRTWNDCPADKKGDKKVCRHIWEKMWRSWVYVEENHLDQAEWFCKVDYDTFFFPENVKYFVHHKHWDPFTEYHYFGHLIQHRQKGRDPMIAGATACWSRKTLDDIADVYRNMPMGSDKGERGKCEDRAQATEEATTSQCLKENLNVSAYAARDDDLREYITIAKYKDTLTWNRTEQGEWWYWKGKPKGAPEMENTIAVRPIGLHKYKTSEEIQQLEDQFFGPPDNKELMRLNPRTKTYVKKVRKAMGTDE